MIATNDATAPRSLATAGLPRRVRKCLEKSLGLVSDELDHSLGNLLNEFEQELFRLADLARNPGSESGYMQTLRAFRMNRADLVPRFMLELEASLAGLRSAAPRPAAPVAAAPGPGFQTLSLVDTAVMDEDTVLREVASRQEGRASLSLHLLGQRFGVLAGSPAFDAERMPLGPQSLCRAMRSASQVLQIPYESRLLLYRLFDRLVMSQYARILEKLDATLDGEGVLTGLTYVPVRSRAQAAQVRDGDPAGDTGGAADGSGQARAPGDAAAAGEGAARRAPAGSAQPGATEARGRAAAPANRPHTAWMADPTPQFADEDEASAYTMLQQLMSGRRELLGKLRPGQGTGPRTVLPTSEIFQSLGALQHQPAAAGGTARTLMDVRQALLAQARQRLGHGAGLSPRDDDTFELLHMLYGQIESEVRADAPAAALIRRLQLPLLRVALQDHAFFVRASHPARQLLGTVAESAAKYLDAEDFDPQLLLPLQQAVNHVVEKYDGDSVVFEDSNKQLQSHLQAQVRKAEMLERRHVEAARGKEKLEVAKLRSGAVLAELIGDARLPKFSRALLNQAWADVLTLTLLRHGEESDDWRRQLEATRGIIAACSRTDTEASPELVAAIESSLSQVGYHGEEATVIAQRLTSHRSDAEDDPASRTELAMKLKARTRLGEDTAKARKPDLPPRTADEQARYEQLRVLPFGTWIEFTTNQQGDVVRRRLSWFSPVTDNALFVNQRGQRVAEHSLDALARMIASGQARIVTAERARLVDRAWSAAMNALRSFAGRGPEALPQGAPA